MKKLAMMMFVVAIGCGGGKGGGGSGVSSSKPLKDLSTAEATDLCEHLADLIGPERTVQCPDGPKETGDDNGAAQCVQEVTGALDTCPITAGQYETCVEAIAERSDADVCSNKIPVACGSLLMHDEACFERGGDQPALR